MTVKVIEGKNFSCGETPVRVRVPAKYSHTGKARLTIKPVDTCVADIVRALTEASIYTDSSCCGHGEGKGTIVLGDGRILTVEFPDGWEAHEAQKGEQC